MINYIKKIVIWIKEYAHVLRVIGGIFFGLSLIFGIIWISGKDVEPIAFTLGLLSSLFLASPSIAEYFVPNRKPIRYMTFDEILKFILTTNAKEDWKVLSTNWSSEAFLKEDPRLRFRMRYDEEGIHNDNFVEPWANNHPDSSATSYWCNLLYNGDLIERYILVSIDGGRAIMPLPDRNTLKVNLLTLEYKVAEIFDDLNSLEEYIKRAKLIKNNENIEVKK